MPSAFMVKPNKTENQVLPAFFRTGKEEEEARKGFGLEEREKQLEYKLEEHEKEDEQQQQQQD